MIGEPKGYPIVEFIEWVIGFIIAWLGMWGLLAVDTGAIAWLPHGVVTILSVAGVFIGALLMMPFWKMK